jgi:hypothetical protein
MPVETRVENVAMKTYEVKFEVTEDKAVDMETVTMNDLAAAQALVGTLQAKATKSLMVQYGFGQRTDGSKVQKFEFLGWPMTREVAYESSVRENRDIGTFVVTWLAVEDVSSSL